MHPSSADKEKKKDKLIKRQINRFGSFYDHKFLLLILFCQTNLRISFYIDFKWFDFIPMDDWRVWCLKFQLEKVNIILLNLGRIKKTPKYLISKFERNYIDWCKMRMKNHFWILIKTQNWKVMKLTKKKTLFQSIGTTTNDSDLYSVYWILALDAWAITMRHA